MMLRMNAGQTPVAPSRPPNPAALAVVVLRPQQVGERFGEAAADGVAEDEQPHAKEDPAHRQQ